MLKVQSVIESGDFSDIPKNETYAAFYLKGWSGIEDEHAGVDIWMCVYVNFDRQPSSIPSFPTIGERTEFTLKYNLNANSITLHWYEKRTQFWQILLGNSMLLLPIEFVQFHSLGACFDQYDKSNFMSGLSYFMSGFFKTDFWLFVEFGVSCTQRAMRWVGSVFLQVHIIGKPLLTHVARHILFLQEILLARNICLQWILFCNKYFFAMNIFL